MRGCGDSLGWSGEGWIELEASAWSSHAGFRQCRLPVDDRNRERRMREIDRQLGARRRPQRELAIARHDHHAELLAGRHELVGRLEVEREIVELAGHEL